MVTPENAAEDLEAVVSALGENPAAKRVLSPLPIAWGEQMVSIRQALFASHELVSAEQALGRICGTPTVSCPPAIPIAVSGEQITAETVELFRYYGVNEIDVLK
jgi:arginine/lysine/ornithine decarboxylase